jgi:hypothetical protein
MYDRLLRLTKNILGIIAIFYFFVPVLLRFLIRKVTTGKSSSPFIDFFNGPIFQPVLHQYDIALGKNSAIYWLAFYVCLMLACLGCWLAVFYVFKIFYLIIKKAGRK